MQLMLKKIVSVGSVLVAVFVVAEVSGKCYVVAQ